MNNRQRTRYKAMLDTYMGNVYINRDEKMDDKNVMILSYSASLSNRYVAPFYYDSLFKHYVYNSDITIQETRRVLELYSMFAAFLYSSFKDTNYPSDDVIGLIDTSNGPRIRL